MTSRSGDGRIVNLAADRYGAHGVRVEIDPQLVWSSRQRAQRADRASREAPERTWLTVDLASATVVALYLSRNANLLLCPKLERVKARSGEEHILYLWRIATEGRHRGRESPTGLRGILSGEE
jgi:hypothetical protein